MVPVTGTEAAWIVGAGCAAGVGALPLLVLRRRADRVMPVLLGFTAGIMLAATAFSLLVPALDRGGVAEVSGGFVLGALAIAAVDRLLPHLHTTLRERGVRVLPGEPTAVRRATLLVAAMTIHNVPEGLAVGIAFAAGGTELGVPIALAIAIQNVPEGFAAAAPLLDIGVRRSAAVTIGALTGLVEPPAALAAFGALSAASTLLPAGLAFAAGAMLYVVVDELIPESHAGGREREATIALLGGFVLMMVLDNALG
jgi:ZIP family zinc transporter